MNLFQKAAVISWFWLILSLWVDHWLVWYLYMDAASGVMFLSYQFFYKEGDNHARS